MRNHCVIVEWLTVETQILQFIDSTIVGNNKCRVNLRSVLFTIYVAISIFLVVSSLTIQQVKITLKQKSVIHMEFYEKFCKSAFSTHLARIFWGSGLSVNFLGGLIFAGINKIHKTFTSCGYGSNLQLIFFYLLSKFSVEVQDVKNIIYPNTQSQFSKRPQMSIEILS